jgi:hypothetical protein
MTTTISGLWAPTALSGSRIKPIGDTADNLDRLQTIKREPNRYTLGRIPLVNGQLYASCPHPQRPHTTLTAAQLKRRKVGNDLTHWLKDDRYLGPFLEADIPGKDNGFDIEGLAIMGDRLWLGLRGPVLRGWAVLLELALKEDDPSTLKLQKIGPDNARYRQHFLNLEGLGIRDLCPWHDNLLILAGPTMTLDGPIKIFSVPLADLQAGQPFLQPVPIVELPHTLEGDRAEGLTLLNGDGPPEVLVVYDAPTATRQPSKDTVLADRWLLP